MEKVYEAICWTAAVVLGLFAAVVLLPPRDIGVPLAFLSLIRHSNLPWWILTPAAIAVVAGFIYLTRRMRRTIPRNRKFVD